MNIGIQWNTHKTKIKYIKMLSAPNQIHMLNKSQNKV